MEGPREAAAAGGDAIALFDACWFHCLVLLPRASPAHAPAAETLSPPPPCPEQEVTVERTQISGGELQRAPSGLRHRRTRSDEATTAAFERLEPLKIPNGHRARLQTIFSGKDGLAAAQPQPLPERRRPEARRPGGCRRRRRRGRSMSELELEEVKGLQDLGFTFSDAEVDAELASIVPGLRRRWSGEEEAKKAMAAVSVEEEARVDSSSPRRPYLSEAWEDEEEEASMLRNWRIPAAGDNGADLKEHLRIWAHTVASAVQ